MIRNYLKIAWRNLIKDRQFTILNLIGLSSGLACTLLIWLWVSGELKIDQFQDKQLYQVMQNVPLADKNIMTTGSTPDILANALSEEIPGVEATVITKSPDDDENAAGILTYGQKSLKAKELFATDNFFDVFRYKLLSGDRNKVLSGKENVILSDQLAKKLFHSTNVIGKTLIWYRGLKQKVNGTYVVSGIFEAPSSNSSLQFDLIFSHELYVKTSSQDINWYSSNPFTYVVLKKGINPEDINTKIKGFLQSKTHETKYTGTLFLQRYSEKYLHNRYENGVVSGGRIEYVKLFSIIAAFILLIACINFMNLSTAKASGRLKEVGIKKAIGAGRRSLILQYLGESTLMALLSMALAILLVELSLPAFKQITGKNIILDLDTNLILSVSAITIITGLIAGSYPALYLSGFKPAVILRGKLNTSAGASWIRKGLVVFQFSMSVVLIISVLIVYQQMKLVQTKNLGYSKDNVVRFSNEGKIQQNLPVFLSELKNIPGVVNASDMEGDMFGNHSGGGGIDWPGKTNRIEFSGLYVDYGFMETMSLKLREGHMFSKSFGADSTGVIFNETAVKMMGLKNPVGKEVKLWGTKKHIIAVVKDFNFESLYKTVGPFFLSYQKNSSNIIVKIKAGTEKETLTSIETLYKKYNTGLPFEYRFLDEDYQLLYASEQRVAVLSQWFAGIAILISCLGLFGLAAFTAQKRQKEIGIRKVVGASVSNIAAMLSIDFLKLVLIAFFVAIPLSLWALDAWLRNFAYRIHINIGTFVITGSVIVMITLVTVSYQAIKAALMNPVKSLKTE